MSVTVAPVAPPEYAAAARLLFARAPSHEVNERVERFLALVASGDVDPSGLLVAKRGNELVGVAVVQFLPGGSAVVIPPTEALTPRPLLPCASLALGGGEGVKEGSSSTLSSAPKGRVGEGGTRSVPGEGASDPLASSITALLRDRSAPLAYTFLDPADGRQADPLVRHGFRSVTQVTHMLRLGTDSRLLPKPSPEFTFTPAQHTDQTVFGDALLATYDGTLDVPEACLDRPAADILVGYRTNQPDPPHWWLATDSSGRPVGVVLLTVTGAGGMDLGYLGVVPDARGRGVGRALLRFAVRAAATLGSADLNLSVDVRNEPALRLYRGHSFRPYQWQQVFLWRPSW